MAQQFIQKNSECPDPAIDNRRGTDVEIRTCRYELQTAGVRPMKRRDRRAGRELRATVGRVACGFIDTAQAISDRQGD